MSARRKIVDALVGKLKDISINNGFETDLHGNVTNVHKFWDEVNDFPFICVVAGQESREYLPSNFKWGDLGISIKLYVRNDEPFVALESLISDVERVLESSDRLLYEGTNRTAELTISSIITDEGLLNPYGIGEINISVRYQVL